MIKNKYVKNYIPKTAIDLISSYIREQFMKINANVTNHNGKNYQLLFIYLHIRFFFIKFN